MIPEDRYNGFRVPIDSNKSADPEIFLNLQSNNKLDIFFILYLDRFYRTFVDENQKSIESQMVLDLTVPIFQILFIFKIRDLR